MFYTQDNGGEPFKVTITDSIVNIYKFVESDRSESDENESDRSESEDDHKDNYIHILRYEPLRIFIGKSPVNNMTTFSGGHGEKYDGNSCLLEMNDMTYIHIGIEIFSFTPKAKIIDYVSSMGNNLVPYPYAVDEFENYYLMIEDVILLNSNKKSIKRYIEKGDGPYEYYYSHKLITSDEGCIPAQLPKSKFKNIEKYFIDEEDGLEKYTLTYNADNVLQHNWNFPKNRKKKHYIKYSNNNDIKFVSEVDYFNLMNEFGLLRGFETLIKTIIEPRI